jgi:hypothetical protein
MNWFRFLRRVPMVAGGEAGGSVSLGALMRERDPGAALGEISTASIPPWWPASTSEPSATGGTPAERMAVPVGHP